MGFASGSTAAMPSASNTRRLESLKADDQGVGVTVEKASYADIEQKAQRALMRD